MLRRVERHPLAGASPPYEQRGCTSRTPLTPMDYRHRCTHCTARTQADSRKWRPVDCEVVLWVVCTYFFVLCFVKSGKCDIIGIPAQPGHTEDWRKALFNVRTNPQLYKRPDVEIKEIEVNLYLQVHRAANYLGLQEQSTVCCLCPGGAYAPVNTVGDLIEAHEEVVMSAAMMRSATALVALHNS